MVSFPLVTILEACIPVDLSDRRCRKTNSDMSPDSLLDQPIIGFRACSYVRLAIKLPSRQVLGTVAIIAFKGELFFRANCIQPSVSLFFLSKPDLISSHHHYRS